LNTNCTIVFEKLVMHLIILYLPLACKGGCWVDIMLESALLINVIFGDVGWCRVTLWLQYVLKYASDCASERANNFMSCFRPSFSIIHSVGIIYDPGCGGNGNAWPKELTEEFRPSVVHEVREGQFVVEMLIVNQWVPHEWALIWALIDVLSDFKIDVVRDFKWIWVHASQLLLKFIHEVIFDLILVSTV